MKLRSLRSPRTTAAIRPQACLRCVFTNLRPSSDAGCIPRISLWLEEARSSGGDSFKSSSGRAVSAHTLLSHSVCCIQAPFFFIMPTQSHRTQAIADSWESLQLVAVGNAKSRGAAQEGCTPSPAGSTMPWLPHYFQASKSPGDSSGSSSSSSSSDSMRGPRPSSQPPASSDGKAPRAEEEGKQQQPDDDDSLPVRVALSMLKFYRQGISPLMQSTCRLVR